VLNARGVRNIYLAEGPAWQGRSVPAFTEDDGQELSSLVFAPDGRTLYFVRGGGPNRAGESPNPTSDPAGAEQAIWRVKLDGTPAERLTEGSQPTPSANGLAFVRRGQVMWIAKGAEKAAATPLFKSRGGQGDLRWSADGARLAFTSNRGTHSFIGVYDVAAKKITWMTPSTDYDGEAVWAPDGGRLAFIRIPYERHRMMFVPEREAQPWSILVGDARTGEARTVWTAAKGRGSAFRGVVADAQLQWGAGNHLVFPWERDGWTHLYQVPVSGGTAQLLTPDDGEVEYVAASPDGTRMLYNTNQGDLDRRHVRAVLVDGSAPPAVITNGDGIEWNPVLASDGTVVVLRSSAREPAQAARIAIGAMTALAPQTIPADFPQAKLVVPQAVMIRAGDGLLTHAQLFLPPDLKPGERRPALIFLHGGSRRQMLLGWNYGAYYHHAYALNQAMALRGAIVLQLNYRSGIGYGMEFREALNYGASGASEYGDLVAAARWLGSRPDVDKKRIAPWGGSYGGFLTAMALTHDPQLFAAGVDIHGVHDWNVGIQTFDADYNKLEDPAATELAFASSPLSKVKSWKAPVLVIHGDDDRNVRFIETQSLVEALRRQGVSVEQIVFPDEIHGFLRHATWQAAYSAAIDFFARQLGTKP
jgi:dipeptidyl aminopeptidase/acylaminoacyl peptidase